MFQEKIFSVFFPSDVIWKMALFGAKENDTLPSFSRGSQDWNQGTNGTRKCFSNYGLTNYGTTTHFNHDSWSQSTWYTDKTMAPDDGLSLLLFTIILICVPEWNRPPPVLFNRNYNVWLQFRVLASCLLVIITSKEHNNNLSTITVPRVFTIVSVWQFQQWSLPPSLCLHQCFSSYSQIKSSIIKKLYLR